MLFPSTGLMSRREALAWCTGAGAVPGGFPFAGPAVALPPPMASKHTVLVLLDAADLGIVRRFVRLIALPPHTDTVIRTPVFSPDGKFVACAGQYSYEGVYNATTGEVVGRAGGTEAVEFRPGGGLLAAHTVVGGRFSPGVRANLGEWEPGREKPSWRFSHDLETPTFSPDGRFLAGRTGASGGGSTIQILSLPSGEERATLAADYTLFATLSGGNHVVTGKPPREHGQPWTIRVWGVKSKKVLAEIVGHPPVAASADGKRIALRGRDQADVVVWEWAGKAKPTIRHGHVEVSAVGLSADGRRLATAGPKIAPKLDRTYGIALSKVPQALTVWDMAEMKPLVSGEVGDVRLKWLTFSPDGKRLLVAGSDMIMGLR